MAWITLLEKSTLPLLPSTTKNEVSVCKGLSGIAREGPSDRPQGAFPGQHHCNNSPVAQSSSLAHTWLITASNSQDINDINEIQMWAWQVRLLPGGKLLEEAEVEVEPGQLSRRLQKDFLVANKTRQSHYTIWTLPFLDRYGGWSLNTCPLPSFSLCSSVPVLPWEAVTGHNFIVTLYMSIQAVIL